LKKIKPCEEGSINESQAGLLYHILLMLFVPFSWLMHGQMKMMVTKVQQVQQESVNYP